MKREAEEWRTLLRCQRSITLLPSPGEEGRTLRSAPHHKLTQSGSRGAIYSRAIGDDWPQPIIITIIITFHSPTSLGKSQGESGLLSIKSAFGYTSEVVWKQTHSMFTCRLRNAVAAPTMGDFKHLTVISCMNTLWNILRSSSLDVGFSCEVSPLGYLCLPIPSPFPSPLLIREVEVMQ